MNPKTTLITLALFGLAASRARPAGAATGLDTASLEQLTGVKGKLDAKAGVFKVSLPRTDLKITSGRVRSPRPWG
jgi:hypothetical protein